MYGSFSVALAELLNESANQPIFVFVNSIGGAVNDALAMHDLIKASPAPIDVIVAGVCASAAFVIPQAARNRWATRHASFMLHEVSYQINGTYQTHADDLTEFGRLQDSMIGVIVARTHFTTEQLHKRIAGHDYYLTAAEALDWGVIDAIVA